MQWTRPTVTKWFIQALGTLWRTYGRSGATQQVCAPSTVSRVCSLDCRMQVATQRGGAIHGWRRCRHRGGECREPLGLILCGLETLLCPRTGLFTGVATPGRPARESQARERGRPRPLSRRAPRMQEPERGSNQRLGLWDNKPSRTLACRDAVQQDLAHACDRLIPCVASEAAGSPALRPEPWRNVSIAKAVLRLSLS